MRFGKSPSLKSLVGWLVGCCGAEFWVKEVKDMGRYRREGRVYANGSYILQNGWKFNENCWPTTTIWSVLSTGKGRFSTQHYSLIQPRPECDILYHVNKVNEVNTDPPYVRLKIQMFLNRPDQEAPDWCYGTDSTEGTFITYWSFLNQNTSVWISLLQRLFRCWKHLQQSARCICISCCVALILIGPHLQTLYRSECV